MARDDGLLDMPDPDEEAPEPEGDGGALLAMPGEPDEPEQDAAGPTSVEELTRQVEELRVQMATLPDRIVEMLLNE